MAGRRGNHPTGVLTSFNEQFVQRCSVLASHGEQVVVVNWIHALVSVHTSHGGSAQQRMKIGVLASFNEQCAQRCSVLTSHSVQALW